MHIGYTGTMVCGDKDRELIVILLTNRVYPTRNGTSDGMHQVRYLLSTFSIADSVIGKISAAKFK